MGVGGTAVPVGCGVGVGGTMVGEAVVVGAVETAVCPIAGSAVTGDCGAGAWQDARMSNMVKTAVMRSANLTKRTSRKMTGIGIYGEYCSFRWSLTPFCYKIVTEDVYGESIKACVRFG